MALQIPDNNAASMVSCDLSDLIEQLPECQDKTIWRNLNSYIESLKGLLHQQGCSDAVLAVNNLQSCTRQLLIAVINNPDDNVITPQSQEVCTAVRNTVAVMRMNHPDEFDQVYRSFQNPPAGIEYRRVDLQQGGSEDLLERLVPFYEILDTPSETRPVIQLQKRRSSPSNPTTETERTPLLESHNAPNERRMRSLKIVGGVLVGVTAAAGLLAGVALLCTGVGAPVGVAVIGTEVGVALAIAGGVTAVTAGGVAVTTGTAGVVALKKAQRVNSNRLNIQT